MTNNSVEKKFDQIADNYEFFEYTLHLRAKKIKKIIDLDDLNDSKIKILDIGVAGGELAKQYLSDQSFTGLDISSEMLKKAKYNIPNGDFIKSDGEDLIFKDNSFDLIIISEVLYYMNDPIRCLSESYRVLKPGRRLIIFSRNQFWHQFDYFRQLIGIGPTDNLFDKMFYEHELIEMANKARFKNIEAETFCVAPFKILSFFDSTPLRKYGHIIYLQATK